VANKLKTWRRR